ncbi:lysis protein [Hafnia paralvei]|uniref:Rz lysis protein n=1 Tax=Hafnia phage yong1 TaxID=2719181 RepID=A0A7D2HG81_9CAUD|nr:lysis protein [Hafnia paralvei]YP_010738120.1 Rz lysis protein [Hafnia phage yong1]MBW2956143.1 lysis protein [Hafnia paralvei]MBW2956995.1 lysis protein [Hafnia paralvei]QIQ67982.1 Rz lysis protein [Hafnia phage yong1]
MSRITTALIAVIIALLVGMWYTTSQMQSLNTQLKEITQLAEQQKADLENIQRQRVQAAELDIKVTQELANAKSEIETLRVGLNTGTKRLRISASCPKLPEATAATGKPDATSPRYDAEFERNYLSLVERIRQSETMINGLQSYVRTQCQ